MSSSPLIFVRDGRTLPFFPVTHNALAAIAHSADARENEPKRLAAARSLYLALLELANQHRTERVPVSRRTLGAIAGISRDLVSDVRPILELAMVVRVEERFHENQQTEHEWVLLEPPTAAEDVSESRPPLAERLGGIGGEPHRKALEEELQEEGSLRSPSTARVESLERIPGVKALCNQLADRMRELDPKAQTRERSVGWLQEADRLMRINERHFEEATAVLDFAMADDFWSCRILSMAKFREKYPTLRGQWLKAQRQPAPGSYVPNGRSAAAAQQSPRELVEDYQRGQEARDAELRRRLGVR